MKKIEVREGKVYIDGYQTSFSEAKAREVVKKMNDDEKSSSKLYIFCFIIFVFLGIIYNHWLVVTKPNYLIGSKCIIEDTQSCEIDTDADLHGFYETKRCSCLKSETYYKFESIEGIKIGILFGLIGGSISWFLIGMGSAFIHKEEK